MQGVGGEAGPNARATLGRLPWAALGGRRWRDLSCLFVDTGFELSCYSRWPSSHLTNRVSN